MSPTRHTLPLLCLSVALLALAGCGRREPAPAPAAEPAPAPAPAADALPPGIAWFEGDVDAAFAAAKAANKPLFLFWGAEWCPPCAQIKSTIFATREFQERSRLFVPVYLDGDTPSAQRQGERFGVVGYPTMILFRPDGQEITRLPGGVDVARYATILDTALQGARPMLELLRAATNGVAMEPADWELLAYYSWSTDAGKLVPAADRVDIMGRLNQYCPRDRQPGECGRLYFEYLKALRASSKGGTWPLGAEARSQSLVSLLRVLGAPAAVKANVENLSYSATDVVGLLSEAGSPEREQLLLAWRAALDSLERGLEGVTLSGPEQINLYRARVQLQRLEAPGAPLPATLLDPARATATRVVGAAPEGWARHAAANAAVNLYLESDLDEEARDLLLAEIERSKSPYYFMLELADLAKKAGREQEAVTWLEAAWTGAAGPATRFQWGYNYLVGLIEMTPEDSARIERVGLEVLGELEGSPDAFYQRTRQRLEQLSGRLLEWSAGDEARRAVVSKLRTRTAGVCAALPADDAGRANCEAFLKPADPAAAAST